MKTNQKTHWWIDLVLFAGFITTFFLDFTGIENHQWIGILSSALASYHLYIHRVWVRTVSKRFIVKTSGQARKYFTLDLLLLLGFALIIVTGLGVSTWLNLPLSNYTTWLNIHITISIITLVTLLLKLTLHWRWIARTVRNIWPSQVMAPANSAVAQPERISAGSMGRREFLQVMGIVGVASFLALINASKGLAENVAATDEVATNETLATVETTFANKTSWSSSNSSCTVRCQKGCSYPGHCHRYVDTNNNNRCDLGECV